MTKSAKDTILNRLRRSKAKKERDNNVNRTTGFEIENIRSVNYKIVPKCKSRTQMCLLIKLDTGIITAKLSQLTYQEVVNLIGFLTDQKAPTTRIKENTTEWKYDGEVEQPMPEQIFTGPTIEHRKNLSARPTIKIVGLTLTLKDVIACKSEEEARAHIKTILENARETDFTIKVKDLTNEAVANFIAS